MRRFSKGIKVIRITRLKNSLIFRYTFFIRNFSKQLMRLFAAEIILFDKRIEVIRIFEAEILHCTFKNR